MNARVESALADVLATAGMDPAEAARVSVCSADPVLPTPFPLGTAGAAAIAAVGLAVDALHRAAGHAPQQIGIAVPDAAAAVRGNEFLRRNGQPVEDLWRGISGFQQTGDGRYLRFHCNFPEHERAALAVLGCSADKRSLASSLKKWSAPDLEDAILDGGGCAYMARTAEEWADHPQAAALAGLPLLEIERIGDADPTPLPAGPRPLSGVRVLDLTRVIAGPVIGRTLAEHGATVMRVASPHLPFIEPLVIDTGHGKLSTHLDLNVERDGATLRRLIGDADVFVQGYRPGAIAGKGFSAEDVARLRPGIVCVDLSAWSHAGPWSHRRGFDSLVQTATGWALELGGAAPKLQPASAIDYVSGYLGAFGALVALRRRAAEGGSWRVRLSLAQTGRWISGLGRVDDPDVRERPVLEGKDVAYRMQRADSEFGRLEFLGPVLTLSETPPMWATPPVPLGTHRPDWPNAADDTRNR